MAAGRKRTMTVDVVVEDKEARQNLKNIDKSTQATADQFGKAGEAIKTAMSVVAVGAVGAFAADLATRAGEIEGIMRRVDTVFGDNAREVEAWAKENASAFGEAEATLLGMAAEIGDLLVPMGLSRDTAADMALETLNAANALSEWTGGQVPVEEAASAMTKAFLGEREELKKLGVSLSQADIDARLAATGQDELEGAARQAAIAVETQKLIFEKSEDALRAYEDGGDSIIRSQKDLKAAVEQAKDELAQRAIPVFMEAFDAASNFAAGAKLVIDWFLDLPGPVKNGVLAIAGLKAALMALYANPIIAGLALVATTIAMIGGNAREHQQMVDDFKTALENAGGAAGDAALEMIEGDKRADELKLALAEAGLTADDFALAIAGDEEALGYFEDKMKTAKDQGKLTEDQIRLIVDAGQRLAETLPEAQRELEILAEAEEAAARKAESAERNAGLLELGIKSLGEMSTTVADGALTDLETQLGETELATDEAKQAQIEYADEQRKAMDPAFRLKDAVEKYRLKLDEVRSMQRDGVTDGEDYRLKLLELFDAQGDLNYATASFDAADMETALRELGTQLGFQEQDVQDLIDWLNQLDQTTANPVVTTHYTEVGGSLPPGVGPNLPPGIGLYQSGGMVPGPEGRPQAAIVHGGEMVLNRQQQAAVFSGRGIGGGGIHVHAGAIVTEQQVEDLIIRVLTKYDRRNGRG